MLKLYKHWVMPVTAVANSSAGAGRIWPMTTLLCTDRVGAVAAGVGVGWGFCCVQASWVRLAS
jgi:hypothetical protein